MHHQFPRACRRGAARAPAECPCLASSTGAGRASARERPFAPGAWPLPRGQGGHPKSAVLPPASGFFHAGREGLPKSAFLPRVSGLFPRGQGGRPSRPFCHPCPGSSPVAGRAYARESREAETPENRIPAGRPKRARSADRRMRPGARFRPGVGGSRVSARKRPKCLFLQCFAVGRAFLQPSRSVSRFSKSQSRGQRQHESAKHGGREGSHCEPVYHLRASSTGAGWASARERPFPTRVWPLPRGQRGRSARFPPVSGFFHGGREGVCQRAPFCHRRLASSTKSAHFPPVSGFFHGGREGHCQRVPFLPVCLASSTETGRAAFHLRERLLCWLSAGPTLKNTESTTKAKHAFLRS